MKPMRYTLVIVRDEEDPTEYNVSVKELAGCYTHGTTIEECVSRAIEAIQGFLESQARDGEVDLPAKFSLDQIEVGLTLAETT